MFLSPSSIWNSTGICSDILIMFNELRWELIVCFVDIGGIVDHHLNFIFIMYIYHMVIDYSFFLWHDINIFILHSLYFH